MGHLCGFVNTGLAIVCSVEGYGGSCDWAEPGEFVSYVSGNLQMIFFWKSSQRILSIQTPAVEFGARVAILETRWGIMPNKAK